jgi:septal ring factor EnvC (AmiA/AmiB activator)
MIMPFTGSIERQIGELTATLQALKEDLGEVRAAIEKLAESQQESAEDRRSQQQIVQSRLEILERTTTSQHRDNIEKADRMANEIAMLKAPVDQFVSIRKRAAAVTMLLIGACSIVWTLAAPVYNFVVTRLFSHL